MVRSALLTSTEGGEDTWRGALGWGLVTYAMSRIIVVAGAAAVSAAKVAAVTECEFRELTQCGVRPKSAADGILEALSSWDGQWYISLVRDGYPSSVPTHITYLQPEARAAFFPVFPLLARAFDRILPGGDASGALVLNVIVGALLIVAIGRLAIDWRGPSVAKRTMMLAALFPGSYVLTFAYSEAIFLLLAALSMLAWHRHRYVMAGLLAAAATASRPNGVALVIAYGCGALLLIRAHRTWRSLITPLMAPIGLVAVQLYIGWKAHEPKVWFRVQSEAWGEGFSFGATAIRRVGQFFLHPLSSPSNVITVLSLLSLMIGLAALWRARLPATATVYSLAISLIMLLPETVTARPRFVYTAFPMIIAVVVAWPKRWNNDLWMLLMALCGAALFGLSVLYGLYAVVIP